MIWNTIMHPRMMDDTSGTGNEPAAFDNVVFSKEALEPPIKHMNRDYLATLDYVIWDCYTSDDVPDKNAFSKTTLLIGDFDSLFAAGKNKTIVNGLLIGSELGIRLNPDTKVAEYYYASEDDGMNGYIRPLSLATLISLYGKMEFVGKKFDFGKDSFVMIHTRPDELISSSGEVWSENGAMTKLMEYVVDDGSSAG